MNRTKFLKLWSVAMGSMDALTGLLLVFAPELVLRMLRIDPPAPEVMVFISWIGVFVMAVGLSYGFALGIRRSRGETAWMFTSLVRLMVAAFLTFHVLDESLARPWALVALSDGAVAAVQIAILRKGWWREVPR